MTDKTDALVVRLRLHARDCVSAADMDTDTVLSAAQIDDMADALNEAAEALAAPAEGASAEDYERELSAVMPEDFKDWHQNDKREWPAVAAAVIRNLREREATAWEQAASVDVEGLRKLFNRVNRRLEESNMPIGHALARSWESDLHGLLIDSAGGAKGDPIPPCACFDHADAICPEHRPSQPDGGDGAVAAAWAEGYASGVTDERTSEANIGIAGFGAKVEPARENPYTRPAATAVVPEGYALIAKSVLREWGKLDEVHEACRFETAPAAPKGGVVDEAWRQRAAEWLEAKAAEQEANNQRWPDHAAAYGSWRDRPGVLRLLAMEVRAALNPEPQS